MRSEALLCPACTKSQTAVGHSCTACGLELSWVDHFPRIRELLVNHAHAWGDSDAFNHAAPTICALAPPLVLSQQAPTAIGRARASENTVTLPDVSVLPVHLWIVPWRDPGQVDRHLPRYFVVAADPRQGAYVNGQAVLASELRAGDVLQIGPFAWCYSGLDLHLVPLAPIAGAGLILERIHVPDRLGPELSVRIEPGQFVSIVGPSGAGKSTLLKVLAGFGGHLSTGSVTILEPDGSTWDRDGNLRRYREFIGYVSQEAVLHEDLTAHQILELSGRLRGRPRDPVAIEWALLRAEIDRDRWQNPVRHLSGGENKRLRTASELMGQPRLLLLDEPDSGLDERRRQSLMQFLRTLSWQGCTVVLVTHATADLARYCDRILVIENRRIGEDLNVAPASDRRPAAAVHESPREQDVQTGRLRQVSILLRREILLLAGAPLRRIAVPAAVGVLFAAAISTAVPRDGTAMLGFLAIISVLWLSSSLSLLGIASEREVFEHERRLFLGETSYLSAKFLTYAALSCCQTVIVMLAIISLRGVLGRSQLYHPLEALLVLILIGIAGASLGLLLSAIAGRNRETATFLLPLVILLQIVFSVPIATENGTHNSVASAYAEFHVRRCPCGRYATSWVQSKGRGLWVCDDCRRRATRSDHHGDITPPAAGPQGETRVSGQRSNEPVRWSAWASYLTVSRQADLALRTFAYHADDERNSAEEWNCGWAIAGIGGWAMGFLALCGATLWARR